MSEERLSEKINTPPGGSVVAAVVVTRNRCDHLRRCLVTLQMQTFPLHHIVVVDNESMDRTAEMIPAEFPNVIYRRLSENLGSGGGYAEALRRGFETGADWLWAIDDEVVLEPDVLERMVHRATGHQRVDIVLPAEFDPRTGRSNVYPAWYGPLIHRSVVERIGLPRSDFFWWGADSEFFRRARRIGFNVLKAADITIVHDKRNPVSIGQKRHPSRLYYQTRNTIYIRWHINRSRRMHYHLGRVVLGRMVRVILSREPDKLRKCLMIGKGALDGLRGALGKTVEIG